MSNWLNEGFRPMQPGVYHRVECYGDKLMLCKVAFDSGAVTPPHTHPHEQISYVLSGKMEFDIAGEKVVLGAGESRVLPPNAPHGAVCIEEAVVLDIFTPLREDFLGR